MEEVEWCGVKSNEAWHRGIPKNSLTATMRDRWVGYWMRSCILAPCSVVDMQMACRLADRDIYLGCNLGTGGGLGQHLEFGMSDWGTCVRGCGVEMETVRDTVCGRAWEYWIPGGAVMIVDRNMAGKEGSEERESSGPEGNRVVWCCLGGDAMDDGCCG